MPAAPQQTKSGLFQVDDGDMDNLFDKVLLNPAAEAAQANAAVQQQQQQPMGAPPAPPPMGFGGAPPQPQQPGNGQYPPQGAMPGMPAAPAMPGMPGGMPGMPGAPGGMPGMPPAPMPAPEAPPAVGYVPQNSNVPPPKIEGIGKLDASADVAETGSGRIAAIGKFLLDQKDLEKLSKITAADQQDIKMRILTLEASEDLQTLLSEIGGQEKVIGSVIVGHDGLLIANTMPEEVDAESIGVWALGVYMNTEHVTKKMGHERVHQVVSRTPRGYVVIADFGGGLLVTITEGTDTDTLIPLMRKITDLVS
jgi:predicted regulator of Ras-like GTPase activity (Roadblock/LC7/MglB family)